MPVPLVARRIIVLAGAVLLALGLGAGIALMGIEAFDKSPATQIKAAYDANTITYRDGMIQIFYDVQKIRDCPATSTRWLWTWVTYKGEQIRLFVPLGVSLAGIATVGEEKYLFSIPLPKGVWDGQWYYYVRSTPACGGLMSLIRHQIYETPSIPITIKNVRPEPKSGAFTIPKNPVERSDIPIWHDESLKVPLP